MDEPMQLSEEDAKEAARMAEIAARAEARAEARQREMQASEASSSRKEKEVTIDEKSITSTKFLSKAEREKLALERLEAKRNSTAKNEAEDKAAYERFTTGKAEEERRRELRKQREEEERTRERRQREGNKKADEFDHEIKAIRDHYLGIKEVKKKVTRPSEKFARIFQFDWEETDDTARSDKNPLYNNRLHLNPMFGRGYIAGIDLREQRKDSKFLDMLSSKRTAEARALEDKDEKLTEDDRRERARARASAADALRQRQKEELVALDKVTMGNSSQTHWTTKSLPGVFFSYVISYVNNIKMILKMRQK